FSGFAFSSELRLQANLPAALSANLLGAMLGGFLEYNSLYFGFRALYIFALVLYGLALAATLLRPTIRRREESSTTVPLTSGGETSTLPWGTRGLRHSPGAPVKPASGPTAQVD